MTLTEDEAKFKRCQESFGDTNLGGGYMEPRPFVASMGISAAVSTAWRWWLARDPITLSYIQSDKGYCGKAGKP
jgi:hypothetical protein